MEERIKDLEHLVLNLISAEQTYPSSLKKDRLSNGDRRNETLFKVEPNKQSLEQNEDRIFSSKLVKRVNKLEENYQNINSLQAELSTKINGISKRIMY